MASPGTAVIDTLPPKPKPQEDEEEEEEEDDERLVPAGAVKSDDPHAADTAHGHGHGGEGAPPPKEKKKSFVASWKLGLGITYLLPEWKRMLSAGPGGQWLARDLVGGVTLAAVAIPLSLAIAISSNVEPAIGLVTAIMGGLISSIMGGTTLACTGPAAAMSVVVGEIVDMQGVAGLLAVTLVSGLIQLVMGILRLGSIVKFVPEPVVAGFTMSIGATIFINQMPAVLGAKLEHEYEIPLEKFFHLYELFPRMKVATVVLSIVTVVIAIMMPKKLPKIPGAPVFAVAAATLPNIIFELGAPTIGALPDSLPAPELDIPSIDRLIHLIPDIIMVFGVASLESLLSSTVADRVCKDPDIPKHDPDQELIGQGLANMGSALFGGIPVTGVIARTSVNINVGAKTRRSAAFHALLLLVAVYALGGIMATIPLSALAGILLGVAFRLMDPRAHLVAIFHASKKELIPFVVTAVVVLSADLLWGVFIGLCVAISMSFLGPPCGRPRMLKTTIRDSIAARRVDVEEAPDEAAGPAPAHHPHALSHASHGEPLSQSGFWWSNQMQLQNLPARGEQPASSLESRANALVALQDFRSGFWWSSSPAAVDPTIVVGVPPEDEVELEEVAQGEEEPEKDEDSHMEFWHVRQIDLDGDVTFMSALRLEMLKKAMLEMPGTQPWKKINNKPILDKVENVRKEKVVVVPNPDDPTSLITTTTISTTDTKVKERCRMRIILDMSKIEKLDVSGGEALITAFNDLLSQNEGASLILRKMSPRVQFILVSLDHSHVVEHALHDTDNIF